MNDMELVFDGDFASFMDKIAEKIKEQLNIDNALSICLQNVNTFFDHIKSSLIMEPATSKIYIHANKETAHIREIHLGKTITEATLPFKTHWTNAFITDQALQTIKETHQTSTEKHLTSRNKHGEIRSVEFINQMLYSLALKFHSYLTKVLEKSNTQ